MKLFVAALLVLVASAAMAEDYDEVSDFGRYLRNLHFILIYKQKFKDFELIKVGFQILQSIKSVEDIERKNARMHTV
jgi:hypothetical protein